MSTKHHFLYKENYLNHFESFMCSDQSDKTLKKRHLSRHITFMMYHSNVNVILNYNCSKFPF